MALRGWIYVSTLLLLHYIRGIKIYPAVGVVDGAPVVVGAAALVVEAAGVVEEGPKRRCLRRCSSLV